MYICFVLKKKDTWALSHFDCHLVSLYLVVYCFGLKTNVVSFWFLLWTKNKCNLCLIVILILISTVWLLLYPVVKLSFDSSFSRFVYGYCVSVRFHCYFFPCYPLLFCWALLTCVAIFFCYMQVSIFVQLFLSDCSCLPLFAKPKRFANVCCCFVLTTFWVMHFCLAGFFAMTKRFLMLVLSQLFVPVECDSYFLCISLSFCDSQWSLLSVL